MDGTGAWLTDEEEHQRRGGLPGLDGRERAVDCRGTQQRQGHDRDLEPPKRVECGLRAGRARQAVDMHERRQVQRDQLGDAKHGLHVGGELEVQYCAELRQHLEQRDLRTRVTAAANEETTIAASPVAEWNPPHTICMWIGEVAHVHAE